MRRFVIIAALALLIGLPTAIAFLPASLANHALAQLSGVDAIRYDGSIWNGRTTLIFQGGPTGRFQWHLSQLRDPASNAPLNIQPTVDWSFTNAEIQLEGAVGLGPTTIALQTEGAIDSAAVAALLNQFDIFLSGEFTLAPSLVRLPYNARSIAKIDLARPIELNWSGGQVSYILANQFNQVTLPSLQGHLVADPNRGVTATITRQSSKTELLDLTLRTDGWAHIRLRRRFFDLVQQPWFGDQDADEIVMEVERQIL